MNVKALRAAGWTIKQIADHLGFHPATVSSWLRNGGPPPKRSAPVNDLVIDERWQARISALLAHNAELQGSSIMRVIGAEGYTGSYQTLTRLPALRARPDPWGGGGHDAHRDYARRGVPVRLVGLQPLCPAVGMGPRAALLGLWAVSCAGAATSTGGSRRRSTRPTPSRGLVQFFEALGRVPAVGRTDRMGQLGRSRGQGVSSCTRPRCHSPATTTCPSRPATLATPSGRARSSGPFGTSSGALLRV